MLKLVDPSYEYVKDYEEAYTLCLKEIEKGNMKVHDLVFSDPYKEDVIARLLNNRDITKLKPGYVPSYDYFLVDGDNFIGEIHIRTSLTPRLLQYSGNIGYGINPKYWRKGYGSKLLYLGLNKAKELIKEDKVLVTCDDDNIGSFKVIENNGGVLENKVVNEIDGEEILTRRYWIKL